MNVHMGNLGSISLVIWNGPNLRKGNVHSADDWLSVLQPVVAR